MKVIEAINMADEAKPNGHSHAVKIKWLSKLDGLILREIHMSNEPYEGYDEGDQQKELIVPFPYCDDIYSYYLQAQIDKENGEIDRYNQNITMYDEALGRYQNWYIRNHRSKPHRFMF